MNNTALKTIKDYNMLSKGDSVVAAVSGGADSMALLTFLIEIRDLYNLNLAVCHVNHLFRGSDADDDEEFVRDFCKKQSIDFYLKRCDVLSVSKERGIGFEECGREIRYDFFNATANLLDKNAKIATAHNLGDCAETLIFNITRGSSPAALSSIAPVRQNIIRPLIRCSRQEIEAYLKQKGQEYKIDKTNADTMYTRNYIRHSVLPLLKKINPSFESAVLNLTELSREQQSFLNQIFDNEYCLVSKNGEIVISELLKRNIAVIRSIITRLCRENNVVVTKKLTDDIISKLGQKNFCISVCKDGFILSENGILRFKTVTKAEKTDFEAQFCLGEIFLSDFKKLSIKKITRQQFNNIKENFPNLLKNCLSYDIINTDFVFRNRKIGDKIALFPRNVTKTLKKLLIESKIEAEKRDIIVVLASDSNVVWAEGLGVSKAAAVCEDTREIILIEVSNLQNGERAK